MANLKWDKVAHMYQFSNIDIQIGVGIRPFRGASIHPDGTKRGLFLDSKGHFVRTTSCCIDEYTPILRHRDDMTDAEAIEIYNLVCQFDDGDEMDARICRGWARHHINTGKFSPAVFHWLISRGFDVFGLIEAGEAIRKGVGA